MDDEAANWVGSRNTLRHTEKPSAVASLRDEKGEFYAIDVGGTNLRVMHCQLGNSKSQVLTHERREIEIPPNRKIGPVQNLFDFIVASFKIFLEMNQRHFHLLNFPLMDSPIGAMFA